MRSMHGLIDARSAKDINRRARMSDVLFLLRSERMTLSLPKTLSDSRMLMAYASNLIRANRRDNGKDEQGERETR